jgi:DNA repair exonuclease SbcCD ATPase subunit
MLFRHHTFVFTCCHLHRIKRVFPCELTVILLFPSTPTNPSSQQREMESIIESVSATEVEAHNLKSEFGQHTQRASARIDQLSSAVSELCAERDDLVVSLSGAESMREKAMEEITALEVSRQEMDAKAKAEIIVLVEERDAALARAGEEGTRADAAEASARDERDACEAVEASLRSKVEELESEIEASTKEYQRLDSKFREITAEGEEYTEEVEARISALETHVKELHSERDALLERIETMTEQINNKDTLVERLMGDSDAHQRRVDEVEAIRASLSQRMEETTEREEEARESLRLGA